MEVKYITLSSYRKKGINAYLVKQGLDHTNHDYGIPIDEENKEKAYRKKHHIVKVRIDNLENGIYRYVEAGGADFNKMHTGYLKIEDGEIEEESDNLNALMVGKDSNKFPEEEESDNLNALMVGKDSNKFPELEGSPKQIDWAVSIRKEFVAKLKAAGKPIPERIYAEKSAKFYIDYRDKM